MTDVVTAVANAYLDCIPTLFIAGAAPLRDAETLPLQGGFDQVALLRPITKWAHRVTHTHRIPDLVAQALRTATTGRPGPVFLEIPIDVLFGRADEAKAVFPQHVCPEAAPTPAPEAVIRALDWLAAAERPAIMAGGGVWFSGGGPALLDRVIRIAKGESSMPCHPIRAIRGLSFGLRLRHSVKSAGLKNPKIMLTRFRAFR